MFISYSFSSIYMSVLGRRRLVGIISVIVKRAVKWQRRMRKDIRGDGLSVFFLFYRSASLHFRSKSSAILSIFCFSSVLMDITLASCCCFWVSISSCKYKAVHKFELQQQSHSISIPDIFFCYLSLKSAIELVRNICAVYELHIWGDIMFYCITATDNTY